MLIHPLDVLTVLLLNMVEMFLKSVQQAAWHPKCEIIQVMMNSRRAKGRRPPEIAFRQPVSELTSALETHRSTMIIMTPKREKMELMTFMPMLVLTRQLLGSFAAQTERNPEMIKDSPPQTRYPDNPSTVVFLYSSGLNADTI